MPSEPLNIPRPPFLYTLDQIAAVLNMRLDTLLAKYIHFGSLTSGPRIPGKLVARNIAPLGEPPEWRVAEGALDAWLRRRGFQPRYQSWE